MMKSWLKVVILTLVLGSSFKAWSQTAFDEAAYKTSKALCTPLMGEGKVSQLFSNFHIYVMKSSLEETNDHLVQMVPVGSSSKMKPIDWKTAGVLGDLLHSEGFMRAMRECFPDERDHHRFVMSLIISEKIGNFIVIAGTYLGVRYLLTKFPQVISKKYLTYYLKTALVVGTLSLPSAVDEVSRKSAQKRSLDERIQQLEQRLSSSELTEMERKQATQEHRALVLQKALNLTL